MVGRLRVTGGECAVSRFVVQTLKRKRGERTAQPSSPKGIPARLPTSHKNATRRAILSLVFQRTRYRNSW